MWMHQYVKLATTSGGHSVTLCSDGKLTCSCAMFVIVKVCSHVAYVETMGEVQVDMNGEKAIFRWKSGATVEARGSMLIATDPLAAGETVLRKAIQFANQPLKDTSFENAIVRYLALRDYVVLPAAHVKTLEATAVSEAKRKKQQHPTNRPGKKITRAITLEGDDD
jgi:hypothetical protein